MNKEPASQAAAGQSHSSVSGDPLIGQNNWPLIDLIIVSWDHARFFDNLFASLSKLDYPKDSWRLHIVINKDGDGSKEKALELSEKYSASLPKMIVHEPHANIGFSGGNNRAITWAMQNNSECVYLLNPDTEIDASALKEAVMVWRSQKDVGSVQSLLIRGDDPNLINSKGNELHFLCFGYCGGDKDPVAAAPSEPVRISYPSGAGVLLPIAVLNKVGLLDETLHSYHEDLDLGWRIMIAGYRNYLAPKSIVTHYYEFSRSISKWHLMERNRLLVFFKNYKLASIIMLLPAMISTDMAIWAFAVKGGWFRQKIKANFSLLKPSTWQYLLAGREKIHLIRRMPDWIIFDRMTYKIDHQEIKAGLAEKVANAFWKTLYASYQLIIRW
ncbi:MAG: glycosyltransferase [Patescibacteria group bacterium]